MSRRTGAPTLEEVAAHAGVSRSTVSRVLNGSPRVASGALAAVEQAIVELGYAPNRAARSLVTRRSWSIALVIPENTARFFSDPYFSGVVQGVADRLAESEYTLTLIVSPEADPERTRAYLRGGGVDGVLVLSHHAGDRSYRDLGRSVPVVYGGRPEDDQPGATYVDIDNAAAARAVTDRLIRAGRTRIATIAGPPDMTAGRARLDGFLEALRTAGLDPGRVARGDFTERSGARAMADLLTADPTLDGLFAANAQMAWGALEELHAQGRRVPDDVAVVCFDDDHFSRSATPSLTAVAQPTADAGRRMASLILDCIAGRDVPTATILPTSIIERGSDGLT